MVNKNRKTKKNMKLTKKRNKLKRSKKMSGGTNVNIKKSMNEEIAGRQSYFDKNNINREQYRKEEELKAFLIKIKTEDISNKILRFKQSQQIDITDELLKKYAKSKNKDILIEVSKLDIIKEKISDYIFQIKNIVSNEKDILKKNKNSLSQLNIENLINLDNEYNEIIKQINIEFSKIEPIKIECGKILKPLLKSITSQTGIDGYLKFCNIDANYEKQPNRYYSFVNKRFINAKEECEKYVVINDIYKYKNSDGNVLYSNEGKKIPDDILRKNMKCKCYLEYKRFIVNEDLKIYINEIIKNIEDYINSIRKMLEDIEIYRKEKQINSNSKLKLNSNLNINPTLHETPNSLINSIPNSPSTSTSNINPAKNITTTLHKIPNSPPTPTLNKSITTQPELNLNTTKTPTQTPTPTPTNALPDLNNSNKNYLKNIKFNDFNNFNNFNNLNENENENENNENENNENENIRL